MGGLLAVVMARAAPVPRLRAAALQVLLARGGDLVARLTTAPLLSVCMFSLRNTIPSFRCMLHPLNTSPLQAKPRAHPS